MKLKKITTQGFKSFANQVSLSFDGGIVGVVGPNGSGKSNINDAIKWVLGEQSIKSLRGDSSDDVIFSGSKLIQAANSAEVTLVFDNSDKKLPNFDREIKITRMIKRGKGSNQYFINGHEARLKDIKEIAMESGIGKSSLAIISQGTISDIAEATPEQRRGVFEEAAGISKYKSRKKEAIRKLESTSEALDKIKTVVSELDKQLGPLKRQAEKARKFLDYKNNLQDIEVSVIVHDINFFSKKLSQLNSELEVVIETKDALNQNIDELDNLIEEKTSHKLKVENEIIKLQDDFQIINNKINRLEIDQSRSSERRRMIIEGELSSSSQDKINAMKEELKDLANNVRKYKIWKEKSISDIDIKKKDIAEMQRQISEINFEVDRKKQKFVKVSTKLAILEDHQNNKSNLFKGVKNIIDNKSLFPGMQGTVAELINVAPEYKVAIEAILVSAAQHIVTDNSNTAVKAVNFLKSNRGGRATFIPLATIKPKGLIHEHEMIASNLEGFVAIASEVIDIEPQHAILVQFLLGNIILTETIEDAKNISKTLNHRYMVVSLEGDIVRAGGVISGGESKNTNSFLGVEDQINKIKSFIPKLKEDLAIESKKSSELIVRISEEQAIIAELNIETARVKDKMDLAESQFNILKVSYESQSKEKYHIEESDISESSENLNQQKASIATLLKAKRESIMISNNDLSQYTIQKTEYEKRLRKIIDDSSLKMTEKAQGEFVLESSKRRLSEEYEMTIDSAKHESNNEIGDLDKAREKIVSLRKLIKDLGYVNVDAIEMFEEINERHSKLKNSEEELFSAQQTILSAIDEMDQIIISRLDETINDVNVEFNNVFVNMFGGGSAHIKYTNPNNLLETGIDVIAQPPGKTVRNLKLFSGGEKSMIAISLLFAILKSKPLPLCILDEVEAALDEANVIRFADYLQKLKSQTQFIVITHRVGTMSRVDSLFGATMQNRGVTSFFSVKLSDAKKLIDN